MPECLESVLKFFADDVKAVEAKIDHVARREGLEEEIKLSPIIFLPSTRYGNEGFSRN